MCVCVCVCRHDVTLDYMYYYIHIEDYYATNEDQYPPEPDQPLYDDVENPVEPDTTTGYEYNQEPDQGYCDTTTGYGGDQEPDQPLYDDVQGEDEAQQGYGGVGILVLVLL